MDAMSAPPPPVLQALLEAMNARDIEQMMACCGPDYVADQPCHRGQRRDRAQVRQTWAEMFRNVPDFQAQLLAWTVAGETLWTEWRWTGRHVDGGEFEMQGVILFGAGGEQLAWGRLYMEPVVVTQEI
jgi:hypothetical protein